MNKAIMLMALMVISSTASADNPVSYNSTDNTLEYKEGNTTKTINITGAKGDKGEQGEQGKQGSSGSNGSNSSGDSSNTSDSGSSGSTSGAGRNGADGIDGLSLTAAALSFRGDGIGVGVSGSKVPNQVSVVVGKQLGQQGRLIFGITHDDRSDRTRATVGIGWSF